jgi:putative nucleotidyltransferase with HDIG domain
MLPSNLENDNRDIETALAGSENGAPFLPNEPWAARWAAGLGRHHALLMALCAVLLWLIVCFPSLQGRREFHPGMTAERDIVATHAALVPDREETNRRRRDAAALMPPVYAGNPGAMERALTQFHRVLAGREYSQYDARERKNIIRAGGDAVRAVYRGGQIRSDVKGDLSLAAARVTASLNASREKLNLSQREYSAAKTLAQKVARLPNLVVDERATQRARREAQNNVREVFGRVQAGDVIVEAGDVITPEKWHTLSSLGMAAPRFDAPTALAQFAVCALLVLLAGGFYATQDRELLQRPAALWLTAITPIVFLLVFRWLLRVPHADFLLLPLATTGAILLTILLNARPGLQCAFLIAALGTLMVKGDIGLFLSAVLAAWSGALSTSNITSRGQLVRAGAIVAVASGVLVGALGVLQEIDWSQLVPLALWSSLAGVLAVMLAVGLAMLLERPFGITTHLRLMELLAPDEQLLRRLQTEAPGTYTHSLMVSLLGEAGAKAVGADALLCRVGGLYHDIGKLRRPHCFVENQGGENIHDRLSPQLSARLILAHVSDGVRLGQALKLPRPILDIIATHHGTSRVEYFYRQAMSQNELLDKNFADSHLTMHRVDENDFRYLGPRPQSKEAAIVLLADAVEASSRALVSPTMEKLEHHVQAMIGGRLREGELAACDLTLRDLGKIENAFLHVMKGALHHRIEYPSTAGSTPGAAPQSIDGAESLSDSISDPLDESANATDVLWMQEALAESFMGEDFGQTTLKPETPHAKNRRAGG